MSQSNSKCDHCGFCNSLNAAAYSAPSNALIVYYLLQAEAVIEELCCDQDAIPYSAQTVAKLRADLRKEKDNELDSKDPICHKHT